MKYKLIKGECKDCCFNNMTNCIVDMYKTGITFCSPGFIYEKNLNRVKTDRDIK